jgi:HSP20 family protein
MDTLVREMWDSWEPITLEGSLVPHTDMYEGEGQLVIKTELPGIDKKDLDVTLEGDRLIIKGEKKEEVKEDATHRIHERYYGRYFRSLTLPYPVKESEISATLEDGVLELRLPKAEEVKARKIEIKVQVPQIETKKPRRKARQKSS